MEKQQTVSAGLYGENPFKPDTDSARNWKKVQENPDDFDVWTRLLQTVDTQGEISSIRTVYAAFLSEFPLCHVYWQNLAQHEARQTGETDDETPFDKAVAVYERGVKSVSPSIDLWLSYVAYLGSCSAPASALVSVMERAAGSPAGRDHAAKRLYDKFLEIQEGNSECEPLFTSKLLRRALSVPIAGVATFYDRWEKFAQEQYIDSLVTTEEKDALLGDTDEEKKQALMTSTEDAHNKAKTVLESVQKLEDAVTLRYYFHFKAMKRIQLEAWTKYIDMAIEKDATLQSPSEEAIGIFERCLVPCANYLMFYIRYAAYLEEKGDVTGARHVLERAAHSTLKRRVRAKLALALFEEAQGNVEDAREVYLHAHQPQHVEGVIRHAQFEHRQGNVDAATKVYEDAIAAATSDSSRLFLVKKYGEYLGKVRGKHEEARSMFVRLLTSEKDKSALSAYVDSYIAYCAIHFSMEEAIQAFERGVGSAAASHHLWFDYAEYLHSFGDIKAIRDIESRCAAILELSPNIVASSAAVAVAAKPTGIKRPRDSPQYASPKVTARTLQQQQAKQARVGAYGMSQSHMVGMTTGMHMTTGANPSAAPVTSPYGAPTSYPMGNTGHLGTAAPHHTAHVAQHRGGAAYSPYGTHTSAGYTPYSTGATPYGTSGTQY